MERSNWARLKECIKKAEEGKELTIGFLGGSVLSHSADCSVAFFCPAAAVCILFKKETGSR